MYQKPRSFELLPTLKQLNSIAIIILNIYGVIPLFLLSPMFAGLLSKAQFMPSSSSHWCSLQAEVCHRALQKLPVSPVLFFSMLRKALDFIMVSHPLPMYGVTYRDHLLASRAWRTHHRSWWLHTVKISTGLAPFSSLS